MRLLAATLASVWRRFGGQGCLSTAVLYRGQDRQLELHVGRERRCGPHPQLRRFGVVLKAGLEQEGVVFALPQP